MVPKTVEQIKEELHNFGFFDYAVFTFMLVGCGAVGLWFAIKSSQKSSATAEDEYLVGGRNMAVFPIAMSLVATFISGISLIGQPTESYLFGTEFVLTLTVLPIMAFIFSSLYLPVFHELGLRSTYEYLERRFDQSVRMLGTILFLLAMMTWLPLVIYVPALAFNQVTGINVHLTTPIVCAVCIFYTSIGGIKAVVWTDVLQTCIMVGALLLTVVKGTVDIGGIGVVWDRCMEGNRLVIPSTEWDVTTRHTVQSLFAGALIGWLNSMLNQNMIQRFVSLSTMCRARVAMTIFTIGIIIILSLCCYTGLLAYAIYADCDPLTTKLASNKDQILPLMIMRILGSFPGLPGVFVSGIFSASLSSLSTALNSVAAVFLEDIVNGAMNKQFSSRTNMWILQIVVIIFGVICVVLVAIVQHLGTVLQVSASLSSISSGPVFGIFTSGILIPWVNAKGALFGGIGGLIFGGFMILGAQNAVARGQIRFPTKTLSVAGCDYYYNATFDVDPTSITDTSDLFPLFKVSYMWFTPIGAVATIIIAVLVSWASGGFSEYIDPSIISPSLRSWVKKRETPTHRNKAELQKMLVH